MSEYRSEQDNDSNTLVPKCNSTINDYRET